MHGAVVLTGKQQSAALPQSELCKAWQEAVSAMFGLSKASCNPKVLQCILSGALLELLTDMWAMQALDVQGNALRHNLGFLHLNTTDSDRHGRQNQTITLAPTLVH